MHINKIYLSENNLWVSYDLETVDYRIYLVAIFTQDGKRIHKIYNLGNSDMIAKLLDNNFATLTAKELIESANRSKHSPFLKC